ncbi:hypothetical protein RvY_01462 [Ramazzottius varieornatus]|uniref:Uncharacterized protein n=1 Tax=Ramazzottius varieornatus TaxID=947166 RepID=A0A1D1UNI0_RAMVA|nr:hypothetical protein RvY_01462 [Ramazzottius varieornatus]
MSLYLSAIFAASVCIAYSSGNPVGYGNNNGYSNNGGSYGGSHNGGFPSTGITWGYGGCCFGFPDLSSYGSGASPFYGGNDAFNFASVLLANRNNGGNGYNNGGNGYNNGGAYGGNNLGNQNSNGFGGGSGNQFLGWYENLRDLINRGSAGGNSNGYGGSYGSNNNY